MLPVVAAKERVVILYTDKTLDRHGHDIYVIQSYEALQQALQKLVILLL